MPLSALSVGFDSFIELTVHDAFLPAAGLLQGDPVAQASLVTVKTAYDIGVGASATRGTCEPMRAGITALSLGAGSGTAGVGSTGSGIASAVFGASGSGGAGGNGVRVSISSKEVGRTEAKLFTSHPTFNETIRFTVSREAASSLTSLSSSAPSAVASVIQAGTVGGSGAGSLPGSAGGGINTRGETVEDYVVVSLQDDSGLRFYGQAYCPFSPHCSSAAPATAPVRIMLQPRNAQDPCDPLYQKDIRTLAAQRLDDFGFVTVSWKVIVMPHGGALVSAEAAAASTDPLTSSASSQPSFPMGLTLKAAWLAPHSSYHRGTRYTTSVEFGGADRFVFQDGKPIFLTIRNATQLGTAVFHCTVQNLVKPELSNDVAVPLPIPSLSTRAALDRDVHWCAAVRTPQGTDLGLLVASVRLSARPLEGNTPLCPDENCARINDPVHQEAYAHVAKDYGAGRPIPSASYGAYQPIYWESEAHVTEAAERNWKVTCVEEAQPTAEHVRHLFEALMGRAQLDAAVARVATACFHRCSAAELTAADLKEFLVTCAFHAKGMSCQEAARFCFVALRRDAPDAVAIEEIHFMIRHALIGKTIELPTQELRRIVSDLFGDVQTVTFADFKQYLLKNYALWATLGVPLVVDLMTSSAQRQHLLLSAAASRLVDTTTIQAASGGAAAAMTAGSALPGGVVVPGAQGSAFPLGSSTSMLSSGTTQLGAVSGTEPTTAAVGADGQDRRGPVGGTGDLNAWRTFVVRVQATGKRFSVTAHVDDIIADVMRMVESSAGIKASKQEWRLNNESVLDPKTAIGHTTLGLSPALKKSASANGAFATHGAAASATAASNPGEVWIHEQEESVVLSFVLKEKNKRWQERVVCAEKILKVRAAVQKKTLIPLSRCILRVTGVDRPPVVLQDRHTVQYYKLKTSDVIEVSHE